MSELPATHYDALGDRFISTPLTRGPWSALHQHGGPPSALLARAIEKKLAEVADAHVVRLRVAFLRPVPIAPVTVRAEVVRAGRRTQEIAATLSVGDDVVCSAQALCVRRAGIAAPPGPAAAAPRSPAESEPFEFGFFQGDVGYHRSMELRLAGGAWGTGATAIWFRPRMPLLPGETLTPLVRAALVADSGNGVGVALDLARYKFLNADTDITLLRPPAGEWICLDATTRAGPHGAGLVDVALLDEKGPIGRVTQCLVIEERGQAG